MRHLFKFAIAAVLAGTMSSALAHQGKQPAKNIEQLIGLQMYTLRNVGTLDEQFQMAHESGYQNVELVGTHDVDAETMKAKLHQYQLNAISAHVQLDQLENNLDEVIAFNQAIGNHLVIMPYLQPEQRPSDARGWLQLGQQLGKIGHKLRKAGITLGYHNHNFEMKKYKGLLALDWIARGANANDLKFEVDCAWVARGGQDPAQLIRRYHDRVIAVHVKDNAGIGVHDDESGFAVVGDGLLAWDEIMPAALQAGVTRFIVEHDDANDPRTVITQAHQYLTQYFSHQQPFPSKH